MIEESILEVNNRIHAACIRSGRDPQEVTLIAVSKTRPLADLYAAYAAGIRDFGENKVHDIQEKRPHMPSDVKFHMIGHLQRNKVRHVLTETVLIHSVDSIRLADQIEQEAAKRKIRADVLLEINVAGEESKFGFRLEEAESALRVLSKLSHLRIKGLMTIAPYVEDPEENRFIFRQLREFYLKIQQNGLGGSDLNVLSMGMTGDYEVAVEEGATMVRIGTGIFGIRT